MGYVEDLRALVGNQALILVRPSVAIINRQGQILLVKYQDQSWGIPGGLMEIGELKPDGVEVLEAEFFDVQKIPSTTNSYIKEKLRELGPKLHMLLKGNQ